MCVGRMKMRTATYTTDANNSGYLIQLHTFYMDGTELNTDSVPPMMNTTNDMLNMSHCHYCQGN